MARRGASMWPWPSGSAASWAGRSNSTGVPAPSAPGTACPRAAATSSSASRIDSGPPRERGLERSLCRRPVRAGGPARSPGRPLAGRPPRQAGRHRGRHGGPLREGPRGRPVQDARRAARRASRPRRSTPRSSTPTSPPGTCTSIPQLGLRLVTEYVPRERWNMALAVRAKDAQLLVEINRALAQLAESGELRKIYAEYGVPFRPPFTAIEPATSQPPTPGSASASGASWSSAWTRPTCPTPAPRTIARVSTSSWRGPWPSGLDVKLRIEWLDIQRETAVGRAPRAPVRPGLRRGRRRQCRRRR